MIPLLLALFAMLQDEPQESGIDLFAVYEDNKEAIDNFSFDHEELETDEEIVNGWLDAQPVSYAGPLRDWRERRRNEDVDTQDRRRDFEDDKKSIRERRIDGRTERAKERIQGRAPLWIGLGVGGAIAIIFVGWGVGKFISGFSE